MTPRSGMQIESCRSCVFSAPRGEVCSAPREWQQVRDQMDVVETTTCRPLHHDAHFSGGTRLKSKGGWIMRFIWTYWLIVAADCLCVHTYVHTDRLTDRHTHTHTYTRPSIHPSIHLYMHTLHTYLHTYTYIYMYIYIYVYTCICL